MPEPEPVHLEGQEQRLKLEAKPVNDDMADIETEKHGE